MMRSTTELLRQLPSSVVGPQVLLPDQRTAARIAGLCQLEKGAGALNFFPLNFPCDDKTPT
ncbi:MAG: hypothetical protein COA47_06250 [Robiginitomaculum sp.]|nr:MAG: hypothetical protein COA47_06250 [Robiginitomaculum sp.]